MANDDDPRPDVDAAAGRRPLDYEAPPSAPPKMNSLLELVLEALGTLLAMIVLPGIVTLMVVYLHMRCDRR